MRRWTVSNSSGGSETASSASLSVYDPPSWMLCRLSRSFCNRPASRPCFSIINRTIFSICKTHTNPLPELPSSAECQLKSWKDCAFEGEASSYLMINLSSRAIMDSAYDKVKLCMSTTQCRSQILIWTFLHMRIFVTMVLYYEPESPKGERMCEWFHHAHHHLHWLHDLHIALSASSMSCTQCNIWKQGS